MGNAFLDATTMRPSSEHLGLYVGDIDESWGLRPLPQGGVLVAAAVRSMSAELNDPSQVLRTSHTTFVAPVREGPVELYVEVLRRGRTMSHLRATLRNASSEHGHVTTAVFGSARRGFDFTDLEPPVDFVPLGEARSFRDPPPDGVDLFAPSAFWDLRLEGRGAKGHAPWEDYEPDRAEHGTWYRLDDPPVLENGTIDPLSLLVFADTMPGAVGKKIGPQQRNGWFAPSVDLTFHLLGECRSEWIFAHNRARRAVDGYGSLDTALWDFGADGTEPGKLAAYATQVCIFSFG